MMQDKVLLEMAERKGRSLWPNHTWIKVSFRYISGEKVCSRTLVMASRIREVAGYLGLNV